MTVSTALLFAGLAANGVGTGIYVRDTLAGRSSPNRATFLMWALAPMIGFLAQLQKGVGVLALATFAAGFYPALILAASFVNRRSYWKLGWFDYLCGLLSGLALLFWQITGEGNVAIAFAILGDFWAALPTFIKAWRHPESESGWMYVSSCLAPAVAVFSAPRLSFAAVAFPGYILAASIVLAAFTLLVPRARAAQISPAPAESAAAVAE